MRLAQILFSQGFGTRRECAGLIQHGQVEVGGQVVDDVDADFDTDTLRFSVSGREWAFHAKALLMLHKPAGYECSRKPRHHPSVLTLLPAPLRARDVQPVGRLDADTTGLLLLSDDGALIHRLTSPKWHVPKLYRVDCDEAVTPAQVAALLAGVVLHDDPAPVRASACVASGERQLMLTLTQGKYHQVKRMVAAVGNAVLALHRSHIGALALPDDLAPGQWAWVDPAALDTRRG
jgi:16S rRNA pseudouridine516 synthase